MLTCLLRGRSTPAMRAMTLPLPLLVLRVFADHAHHAAAVDDLALVANFLYRCPNLHKNRSRFSFPVSFLAKRKPLFVPVDDPSPRQVVGRKLHGHAVAGKNANEVLAHLAGDVRQHLMFVLQFHPEHGIGQRLNDHRHHFDRVFLAQMPFLSFPARHRGPKGPLFHRHKPKAYEQPTSPRPTQTRSKTLIVRGSGTSEGAHHLMNQTLIPVQGPYCVKITGPSAVTATQCSKWALKLPSSVTAVQRSSSTRAPALPAFTMGSMAITMPSRSRAPCPRVPKFGTCGSSWSRVPMPWPTNSRTTLNPAASTTSCTTAPTSPTVFPTRAAWMAFSSDSRVTSKSFF